MQDKKSFSKKIRDKGYYIVLALCVAAVGVSGYLFCRSLATDDSSTELGAALSVTDSTVATAAPSQSTTKEAGNAANNAIEAVIGTSPVLDEPDEPEEPAQLKTVAPVNGEVAQTYSVDHLSYNVTTKDWRTHDGIDINGTVGDTVCAAADGVVDAVFTDDFLGKTVTIRHENGYVTHYSNLAETVNVAVGDTVKAGDAIGTIGTTALLEVGAEPHLHFAVRKNNVSIDPISFLPQ